MARIEILCPFCKKHRNVSKEWIAGKITYQQFSPCNHVSMRARLANHPKQGFKVVCLDCEVYVSKQHLSDHLDHNTVEIPIDRDYQWSDLFEYQRDTIEFVENAEFNAIIGHEQGLGKTPIAAKTLAYNRDKLFPTLIICPASITPNWRRELMRWLYRSGEKISENLPIIHNATCLPFLDDHNVHIISNMRISKPTILESAKQYGFKSLIVDECHHFKSDGSQRTKALIEIAKTVPYKILMSGTNVLNRTSEFFNALHIVAPHKFPTRYYLNQLCISDKMGRPLAIAPYYKERFNDLTKNCVIRYTKKELFKVLPPKLIEYTYVNVTDNKSFVNLYNALLEELETAISRISTEGYMNIIALMQKIWEYVAMAKTPHAIDKLLDFLVESENGEKIAIGTHHIAPREYIKKALVEKGYKYAEITSQDPFVKQEQEDMFREDPECRVLIASILGAGEGRNLHFCHNAIMMERYWNPAKEQQFQDRFYLRGKDPKNLEALKYEEPVTIDYILADNMSPVNTYFVYFSSWIEK